MYNREYMTISTPHLHKDQLIGAAMLTPCSYELLHFMVSQRGTVPRP